MVDLNYRGTGLSTLERLSKRMRYNVNPKLVPLLVRPEAPSRHQVCSIGLAPYAGTGAYVKNSPMESKDAFDVLYSGTCAQFTATGPFGIEARVLEHLRA